MFEMESKGLRKVYITGQSEVEAISGLDLQVEKGEFLAVMGPSGSGKSTLLNLLSGLDEPTAGSIKLRDRDIKQLGETERTRIRRREVGFVFQFFNLLPTLTTAENIALPLMLDGLSLKSALPRVLELLNLIGMEDRKDHFPHQLSGGEQQRAAIARAMIAQPAVLLADEPTGNLDTKSGRIVLTLLRQACDQVGQTVLLVTHDPTAAAVADRVLFLRDGRIVRSLTASESSITPEVVAETLAALERDSSA